MVKSFRAWAAAIVALLVLPLSSVDLPHLGAAHHDADFDIVVVAHDASAHRVTGDVDQQTSRPDHCLACHWGRSFRPGIQPNSLKAPVAARTLVLVPEQPFVPSRAPSAQPPLRSPPFSSIPS